jgi:hypothetical protein
VLPCCQRCRELQGVAELQGIERCRVALGFTQSDAQGSASPPALVWRTIHTVQYTPYIVHTVQCIVHSAIFQCNAASCTTVSTAQAPLCLKYHSAESSVGWCRTQKFSPTLRQWLSLVQSRNEERGSGGYLILPPPPLKNPKKGPKNHGQGL